MLENVFKYGSPIFAARGLVPVVDQVDILPAVPRIVWPMHRDPLEIRTGATRQHLAIRPVPSQMDTSFQVSQSPSGGQGVKHATEGFLRPRLGIRQNYNGCLRGLCLLFRVYFRIHM